MKLSLDLLIRSEIKATEEEKESGKCGSYLTCCLGVEPLRTNGFAFLKERKMG